MLVQRGALHKRLTERQLTLQNGSNNEAIHLSISSHTADDNYCTGGTRRSNTTRLNVYAARLNAYTAHLNAHTATGDPGFCNCRHPQASQH